MKTIGIRTNPNEVTIAVYDTAVPCVVNVEQVKIPKALQTPEALKYVRNTILDILREFEIERAGLRITESISQHRNIRRLEIEGVIKEAFASSQLESFFCGQISSISARIGIERADFRRYVNGEIAFDAVENWDDLDKEEREAVFAALGAEHA